MKTITRIFLLSCICFLSCGKDSSTPDPTPVEVKKTKTDFITLKIWKIGKNEKKTSTGVWENAAIYDCDVDDTFLFKLNFTIEEAFGTKCPGTTLITPWAFLENETKLKWDDLTYGIVTLNETIFVLDVSANQRVTLVH